MGRSKNYKTENYWIINTEIGWDSAPKTEYVLEVILTQLKGFRVQHFYAVIIFSWTERHLFRQLLWHICREGGRNKSLQGLH
jgi:hypothetical protein